MKPQHLTVAAIVSAIAAIVVTVLLVCIHPRVHLSRQKVAVTDMQSIQEGLRAFSDEHGDRVPVHADVIGSAVERVAFERQPKVWPTSARSSVERIRADLAKYYVRGAVPTRDGWGNPYLYGTTVDGQHYAVVSMGSDGRLDVGMHPFVWPSKEAWRDIVLSDGAFVSYPYGVSVASSGRVGTESAPAAQSELRVEQ